jgi:hypothetical protein
MNEIESVFHVICLDNATTAIAMMHVTRSVTEKSHTDTETTSNPNRTVLFKLQRRERQPISSFSPRFFSHNVHHQLVLGRPRPIG